MTLDLVIDIHFYARNDFTPRMAVPCTPGARCTLGWFAITRNRRPRWVIPRGLHTTRNILASSLIQWRSSGRLNRGLSWLNAVPLGKLNPTTRPKLYPNSITSGIPHRALEDGVCTGMFIPKGSLVIANTRWTTDYESELMSPEPPLKRYIYERGSLSQAIFF